MGRVIDDYSPYYSNGWKDYSSGGTTINAASLNNYDTYLTKVSNHFNKVPTDLTPIVTSGVTIAKYTPNTYDPDVEIKIPDYESRIAALEAKVAALEGNS